MNMVKRVLTVAGSDSGGGAGIQADLKTFAAHGVHGMSAITCITAQNTEKVTAIQPIPAEIVREQIKVVVEDIGVDAVKTGMLFSSEIIEAVSDELSNLNTPIVVDPVAVAKSGAILLREEAVEALVERLFPLATVVTPNIHEASLLTGVQISSTEDMVSAAEKLAAKGPKAVVVKGGHLPGVKSVDILLYAGNTYMYESEKIETKNTHGTGCCFASAIASNLAKGYRIPQAVRMAQRFVVEAVRRGLPLGRGHGPIHPTGRIYENGCRMEALKSLRQALDMLKDVDEFPNLIPESGSNIVTAIEDASEPEQVASIPGRIVRLGDGFKPVSEPWFGGSKHVAKAVITVMKHDPSVRSAMNIRVDENLLKIFETLNLSVSFYDRAKEPAEVKRVEGMTIPWGVEEAVKNAGGVPDIIYHLGDVGKEPMALIFGETPLDVVRKVIAIAKKAAGESN
uniref:Bifunctional hydroxymethylpyrimidine kinase/phosphomethylpyrimidine kinase n=1 Tax=Caldiarchaeum subterraneum TaxID=311458 RepID=A0A7C5LDQ9_CALS0